MTQHRQTNTRTGRGWFRPAIWAAMLLLAVSLAGCGLLVRQGAIPAAGALIAGRTAGDGASLPPTSPTTSRAAVGARSLEPVDLRAASATPLSAPSRAMQNAPSAAPAPLISSAAGITLTGQPAAGQPAAARATTTAAPATVTPMTSPAPALPSASAPAPSPTARPAPPAATPEAAASPQPEPRLAALAKANVRGGPGTNYPVIGSLPAGESYPVTGKSPDGAWLQFAYRGVAGWVRGDLVALSGNPGALAVAQNIPPPPTAPPPTAPPPTVPPPTARPAPPAGPSDPASAALVARINKARAAAGLNQLAWAPELGQAAAAHVNDMAAHHFFSHTGSDGSDVTVRMQRAGYKPVYWGEILTHVNGGPDAAFDQFWGSQHHHDIMLGGNFREIGAAWIRDPADGRFNYFAVVFGRR